jgi:hypothetical protein
MNVNCNEGTLAGNISPKHESFFATTFGKINGNEKRLLHPLDTIT